MELFIQKIVHVDEVVEDKYLLAILITTGIVLFGMTVVMDVYVVHYHPRKIVY